MFIFSLQSVLLFCSFKGMVSHSSTVTSQRTVNFNSSLSKFVVMITIEIQTHGFMFRPCVGAVEVRALCREEYVARGQEPSCEGIRSGELHLELCEWEELDKLGYQAEDWYEVVEAFGFRG